MLSNSKERDAESEAGLSLQSPRPCSAPSGRGSWRGRGANPCSESLTRDIPPRRRMRRRAGFAQQISAVTDDERESLIREQLMAGNIPQFAAFGAVHFIRRSGRSTA